MYLEHCRMNAPGPSADNRCLRRRVYDREYGTDGGNPHVKRQCHVQGKKEVEHDHRAPENGKPTGPPWSSDQQREDRHDHVVAPGRHDPQRNARKQILHNAGGNENAGNPRERGRRRLIHSDSRVFLTYLAH